MATGRCRGAPRATYRLRIFGGRPCRDDTIGKIAVEMTGRPSTAGLGVPCTLIVAGSRKLGLAFAWTTNSSVRRSQS